VLSVISIILVGKKWLRIITTYYGTDRFNEKTLTEKIALFDYWCIFIMLGSFFMFWGGFIGMY
jgi:hypothetical protein